MKLRAYYSMRANKVNPEEMDLPVFKMFFKRIYGELTKDGYFQKYFGIDCTDGFSEGLLGEDIDDLMYISFRKKNLWPILNNLDNYTEDDLFDVIEFLYDHCSKPIEGYYHSWNNCGYHYQEFNDEQGRLHYKSSVNEILSLYQKGYELSSKGELLSLPENGIKPLLDADIPSSDNENIVNRVNAACTNFRKYKATLEDRKTALRELADVLEYLRSDIKFVFTKKDESDLFNLINNFGIRHHNIEQKTNYDKAVWYSWMFYHFLSTIHVVLRLRKTDKT